MITTKHEDGQRRSETTSTEAGGSIPHRSLTQTPIEHHLSRHVGNRVQHPQPDSSRKILYKVKVNDGEWGNAEKAAGVLKKRSSQAAVVPLSKAAALIPPSFSRTCPIAAVRTSPGVHP